MLRIGQVLEEEGRRRSWLAEKLGVSSSQVTRLIDGERRWTDEAKEKAIEALRWEGDPEALFEVVGLPEMSTESEALARIERAMEQGLISKGEYVRAVQILTAREFGPMEETVG